MRKIVLVRGYGPDAFGMAGLAQAGCTAEEAQQKAATLRRLCRPRRSRTPRGTPGDAGAAARTPPDPAEAGR